MTITNLPLTPSEIEALTTYGGELARLRWELAALGPSAQILPIFGPTDRRAWIRAQALVSGIGAVALEIFRTGLLAEDTSVRIASGMSPDGDPQDESLRARQSAARECRERPGVSGESAHELLVGMGLSH